MAGLNQLISAIGAELEMQPHHLAKIFWGRNWLDLSKFDWNWEKIGKIKAKFEQG